MNSVFTEQGLFFSGAALVTFGGAYAVLAYVAQQAVHVYGWLGAGEMVRGLALAETTPGPLTWWCSSSPSSAPTATPAR
jgi:chromate transporter